MGIVVIKPGMHSSFQDLGRFGYQQFGIPVNGVMDEGAHRLANALVGNTPDRATLEMLMMGPVLRFDQAATISVCGADLSPQVDGSAISLNRAMDLPAGATLSFGRRNSGLWSYLAVHGGYALAPVMGSYSTNTSARYGGISGLPLQKGDNIPLTRQSLCDPLDVPIEYVVDITLDTDAPIRIIKGREWSSFLPSSKADLLGQEFAVTPQSNRMGYRLSGPKLHLEKHLEVLSEGVACGTIQVPPDGNPMILLADRGTTGGYPRIANVISADLSRVVQKQPSDCLSFDLVSLEDAQRLLIEQESIWTALSEFGNP